MAHVAAIDQGTTGSTALVLDGKGRVVGRGYSEFRQHFPKPGWVEHDADEIWKVSLRVLRDAVRKAGIEPRALSAIGITNQRETTVLWDRETGRPVHRAIVWQDRRTASRCDQLREQGRLPLVAGNTGLVLDAYFSGTKLEWLLANVPGAAKAAARGRLAFGTIDSWLVWKLTGGAVHATDYTNASRTMLFDVHRRRWDPRLLDMLGIPASLLPEARPSSGEFGRTAPGVLGRTSVPITGIAGDQQAALFGQQCVRPGMVKNTYGTGCFVLTQTGDRAVRSRNGLLTTIACGPDGGPAYALEGSVFVGGAVVQWLRDGLRIVSRAADTEKIATSVASSDGVHVVPAFVGLGAPHWDSEARGAILGITRGTTRAHVVRAALESIAFQSRDVIEAMDADMRAAGFARGVSEVRVDGGAAANGFLMQFQADQIGVPVDRPKVVETTALGAAYLAGLGAGVWQPRDLERMRVRDRVFRPRMKEGERECLHAGWKAAVARVLLRPGTTASGARGAAPGGGPRARQTARRKGRRGAV
jgi:glycerol kinase